MVNYLRSFCQIKKRFISIPNPFSAGDQLFFALLWPLLCSLFLTSCGFFSSSPPTQIPRWTTVIGKANWFEVEEKFTRKDKNGQVLVNPFFDLEAGLDVEGKTVQFLPLVFPQSQSSFSLDIVSGEKFWNYQFCPRKDLWEKYSGSLQLPNFTLGVVPGMLDKMGQMQRVIVFGNDQIYRDHWGRASHGVQVVGAMLEQTCQRMPCHSGGGWLSRPILIAVNPADEKISHVTHLTALKKLVDWNYMLAFMQNYKGTKEVTFKQWPRVRMVGRIRAKAALKFIKSKNIIFSPPQLSSIRHVCHKLYNHAWLSFGRVWWDPQFKYEPLKKELLSQQDRASAALDIVSVSVYHKKNKNQDQHQKQEDFRNKIFRTSFLQFVEKYSRQFATCTEYVATSNQLYDFHRLWFFVYLDAFFKAKKLGYAYLCGQNKWSYVGIQALNTHKNRFLDLLKECDVNKIVRAMNSVEQVFSELRDIDKNYYRFIDYDNVFYGTHHTMFSWVLEEGPRGSCTDENLDKINNSKEIFPSPIPWPKSAANFDE